MLFKKNIRALTPNQRGQEIGRTTKFANSSML
jgi:hypothetical protein